MHYQSIFRADLFAGQTIIVSGGGTGIGRATAHELASLGAFVVLASRKPENLEKVAGEIRVLSIHTPGGLAQAQLEGDLEVAARAAAAAALRLCLAGAPLAGCGGSQSSLTEAENWAESAMTATPQISTSAPRTIPVRRSRIPRTTRRSGSSTRRGRSWPTRR